MVKSYTAEFKKKVVLDVLRGDSPLAEISSKNNLHPRLVQKWKAEVLNGITLIFQKKPTNDVAVFHEKIEALEKKVGQLVMEIDFIKKNTAAFR